MVAIFALFAILCLINGFLYLAPFEANMNLLFILTWVVAINFVGLYVTLSYIMQYILFPFSTYFMKYMNHYQLNQQMITVISKNFNNTIRIIRKRMLSDKFSTYQTFREYKFDALQIKQTCDFVTLFTSVNKELIEGDMLKKRRGKKSSRHAITPRFIRATQCMERIEGILASLKVVSINQFKHKEGVELSPEHQTGLMETKSLRTIFNHFYH